MDTRRHKKMDKDPIEKHLHKPISEILVNKGFLRTLPTLKLVNKTLKNKN